MAASQRPFRILTADLTRGSFEVWEVDDESLRAFIGGASLAARLLYPHLTRNLDPLSPPAPLLFLAGPLTGTTGPAVGRFVICAKSPATGLWGESNAGGFFGPELRAAGFDGLWLEGRAGRPSYLWIHDGKAELRDADHLWGALDTYQTQEAIRAELNEPKARVAAIGLAGENRLPIALILCDHGRVAGRTGMGAVMGSKNLKAVAVRGQEPMPLHEPGGFAELRRIANRELRADSVSAALRALGSSSGGDYFDYLGDMPKYYFTRGFFEGTAKVTGSAMAETILTGVSTCHGCVIACGRRVTLADGEERKGPEYETIVGFGPNLGIDDLAAIARFGELCDRLGMDTISLSNVIGLTFRLAEMGVLPDGDRDGIGMTWGNIDAVEHLIHKTARREGLGELLAAGARALATHYGAASQAVQVNGLEVAYHDPRGASGMALVYATSPRGACHNQGDYFMVDIGQSMDEIGVEFHSRQGGTEKAGSVARHQDWRSLGNSLVLCQFANVPPARVRELLNAATGYDYELPELMQAGERGWNLKRAVNHRLGLTGADDRLPEPLLQPMPDGGSQGYIPPFREMLAAYYEVRGWDPASGRPLPERLQSLGLGQLVADLWEHGETAGRSEP